MDIAEVLPEAAPVLPKITKREKEVLELVAEGRANRSIARKLGISQHTVKFHINALLTKFDAGTRTHFVVKAMRLGLIT